MVHPAKRPQRTASVKQRLRQRCFSRIDMRENPDGQPLFVRRAHPARKAASSPRVTPIFSRASSLRPSIR